MPVKRKHLSSNTCHRAFHDLLSYVGLCQTCKSSDYFMNANSMNPGPGPSCLKDLSYVEQMMIAQIHPVSSKTLLEKTLR